MLLKQSFSLTYCSCSGTIAWIFLQYHLPFCQESHFFGWEGLELRKVNCFRQIAYFKVNMCLSLRDSEKIICFQNTFIKIKVKSVQISSNKQKIKILKFLKVSSLLYPWLLYYAASMKKVVPRDWIFQWMEIGQKLKQNNLMQIFKVFVMQLPDAMKYKQIKPDSFVNHIMFTLMAQGLSNALRGL